MMGDYHVRFCEGLGGQFPWSTRHNAFALFCIGVKAILVAEPQDFGFLAPNFFGSPRKGAG
jgi:hypothetical protein